MSDPSAEVRIRLVLDDVAAETAKQIETSLGRVAAASKKVEQQTHANEKSADAYFTGLAKGHKSATSGFENMKYVVEGSVVAMAAGVAAIGAGIAGAGALAESAFHAAMVEGEEVKKVGSAMMMMAGENASLNQIKSVSKLVHNELEDTAIAMGVSAEQMTDAFTAIAERSGKSVDQVQELTTAMAKAGRISGLGMSELSEGFAAMEAGVVRAKNPVVQLIAATSVLHGNAKQVATQLQKMSPDKMLELGEKAVTKMAEKAKEMPLSFNAAKQSMADMKRQILEDMGAPIVKAVISEINVIRTFFLEHQELIATYAKNFGQRVAEFIKFVGDFMRTFVSLESNDANSISNSLSTTMDDILDAWDDIKNDGASVAKAFKDVVDAARAIVDYTMTASRIISGIVTGGLSEGVRYVAKKGFEMATGTGSSAVPGELDSKTESALRKMNRIAGDMNAPIDKLQKAQQKFHDAATAAGMSADEIHRYIQGALDINSYAVTSGGGEAFHQAALKAKTNDFGGAADFVMAYQAATKAHDDAARKYAEGVFEKSKDLQRVLIESGILASGALEGFGDNIKNATLKSLVGEQLKKIISNSAGKGAAINMNGGQTFNLKQDFRDQDPDRVFVAFQRDVSKAAASRTQSRMAGVFGS
jgi:hypothetical protein